MGAAVTGALLAETKIAKAGLGFMIVEYYGQFRIADMYSLLLFIFILAASDELGDEDAVCPAIAGSEGRIRTRGCIFNRSKGLPCENSSS